MVKCKHCLGYGWSSVGYKLGFFYPVNKRDYEKRWNSKNKILKCPWCSKGDVSTGPMYKALENLKKEMEKK